MTDLEAALRQICRDLSKAHVTFAVVGGLAVSARTEPRFTRDADIAVAVGGDEQAEALIRGLRAEGYTVSALVEQQAVARLATVRLTRSPEPFAPIVDLLFASSGIEPEIVAAADAIELLPRFRVPVAVTGHLIALKLLSRDDVERPQDLADLRALLRVASHEEIARARTAIRLIRARGFHRGRDLVSALSNLLAGDHAE